MANLDLDFADCTTPEDAIAVLRNAARLFYDDASELQDKKAVKFWKILARDLDRVAYKAFVTAMAQEVLRARRDQ